MNDTSHLLLIRHGSTLWNEARPSRLQGSGIDLELSPTGQQQVAALAQQLKRYRLAKVYSSTLLRARQTAGAIAASQNADVEVLENLQEINVGQWEGYDWPRIKREFPEEYRLFHDDLANYPYLGGESCAQVLARAEPILLNLFERHRGEMFAVVAHGIVNRVFLTKHMGCTLQAIPAIAQTNGCVNLIRWRAGAIRVLGVNSVMHLDEWPE
jgi:broad specificity phosphatase PhoE